MASLKRLFFNNASFSGAALAIINNTPSANEAQKIAINDFVNVLINSNIWPKIIALWGIGATSSELRSNCKNIGTFTLTENAGGTYNYSLEGILIGSNTSSYFTSGINCLNNIGSNASLIASQTKNNLVGNLPIFGAVSGTKLTMITDYGASVYTANVNKELTTSGVLDKNIIFGAIRSSSSDFRLFRDSVEIASNLTAISGVLPNIALDIGRYTASFYCSSQTYINLMIVSSGLTISDYLIIKTAINNFNYAYGKWYNYYLFYGDSNTEAPSIPTTRFSKQVSIASNKFETNKGHSGWSLQFVSNPSNSGYANRLTEITLKTKADDLYILMWGTNDIGYNCAYAGYSSANFNTQYRLYIDHMLAMGISVSNIIIISPPYQTQAARNSFWGTNINNITQTEVDVYLSICAQIALDYGIKYIEIYNDMAPNYLTLLSSDGVHLTQAGHDYLTQKILQKIIE